jgi:hypothetical protein
MYFVEFVSKIFIPIVVTPAEPKPHSALAKINISQFRANELRMIPAANIADAMQ